jgi:hypothetical protein
LSLANLLRVPDCAGAFGAAFGSVSTASRGQRVAKFVNEIVSPGRSQQLQQLQLQLSQAREQSKSSTIKQMRRIS